MFNRFLWQTFFILSIKIPKKNHIKDVIISVGYQAEQVQNYVRDNINFMNVKIISDGKNLLGTGGAIKKSIKFLKDYFYVIYGDSYLNFNLNNLKSKVKFPQWQFIKKNKYDKSNVERKNSNYIVYDKSKKR